jgi:hypothetical protein
MPDSAKLLKDGRLQKYFGPVDILERVGRLLPAPGFRLYLVAVQVVTDSYNIVLDANMGSAVELEPR